MSSQFSSTFSEVKMILSTTFHDGSSLYAIREREGGEEGGGREEGREGGEGGKEEGREGGREGRRGRGCE